MNAVIGIVAGLAFGWITYGMLGRDPVVTRKTALLVAAFAAAIATQFQPIFDPSGGGAALRLAGIAWAAFAGSLSIVTLRLLARKVGRD